MTESFSVYLETVYDSMVSKVKKTLETVGIVSTTDSTSQKLFGDDCPLDRPTTLKRCKAAIACTRIMGQHTYDVLASKIE